MIIIILDIHQMAMYFILIKMIMKKSIKYHGLLIQMVIYVVGIMEKTS